MKSIYTYTKNNNCNLDICGKDIAFSLLLLPVSIKTNYTYLYMLMPL